ncbi:hypothetical protein [Clostridium sp.]|uniref:hypothetical protein n=1 Tax=Clostridium sp. TaxID=1506 RepID=UPI0028404548|nr:hypothetical protein [Clostridium sp.]MDR3598041.1 hypothetical protein [Clostridium sp.]
MNVPKKNDNEMKAKLAVDYSNEHCTYISITLSITAFTTRLIYLSLNRGTADIRVKTGHIMDIYSIM